MAVWRVSENLLVTAAVAMRVKRILSSLASSGMNCPITLETLQTETKKHKWARLSELE